MKNNDGWSGYVDPGPYLIKGLEKDAPIGSTFELRDPFMGDFCLFTIESDSYAGSDGVQIVIDKIDGMWHHKGIWIDKNPRSIVEMLIADEKPQEPSSNYWFENQEKRNNK